MRRLITTAVIALAFVGGLAIGGDVMPTADAALVACSATLTNVTVTAAGAYIVKFADGSGYEFSDKESMLDHIFQIQTPDNAQRLLMAWWIACSPPPARSTPCPECSSVRRPHFGRPTLRLGAHHRTPFAYRQENRRRKPTLGGTHAVL